MLKIKRGLANLLEGGVNSGDSRDEPAAAASYSASLRTGAAEEEAPQRAEVPAPQAPQRAQPPQSVPHAPQPSPQPASRPAEDWGDLLVRLLAAAPEDVAQRLVSCLDRDVLVKAFEGKSDPYLKVALMFIKK